MFQKQHVIAPSENLPSRSVVSRKALLDVYEAMLGHVKKSVKNASPFGSITLDGWSDRYKKNSYHTFIYHAITGKLNLSRVDVPRLSFRCFLKRRPKVWKLYI